MYQIQAEQFGRLRKNTLAEALANTLNDLPHYQAQIEPGTGDVLSADAHNQTTRFGFDTQGFVGKITSPLGRIWHLKNGPEGRMEGLTNPAGVKLALEYDAQYPRVTRVQHGQNIDLKLAYDPLGNLSRVQHADGSATDFAYQKDKPTQITNRLGQNEQYEYDDDGNLIAITDANGHTTRFEYSIWDRPDRAIFPDGRIESYQYDEEGRLAQIADQTGIIADLSYQDGQLKPQQITYSDGEVLNFTYDDKDRITTADNATAKTRFTYDEQDRLAKEQIDDKTIEYHYDALGNISGISYPSGDAIQYSYDADQRLSQITDWQQGIAQWRYARDESGYEIDYPNRLTARIDQTPKGQIASIRLGSRSGYKAYQTQYHYDQEDRVAETRDTEFGARRYQYDKESQLLAVDASNPAKRERYAYDPAGNRIQANGINATFDAANKIQQQGDIQCTYDALGNLGTQQNRYGIWQYTWNRRGLLTRAASNTGQTIDYAYDAFGRRIWQRKTTPAQTGENNQPILTRYWWAGEHLIAELQWQGEQILRKQEYAYLPGSHTPYATRLNGHQYYYHNDHLGIPKRLTDEGGNIVWAADHSAFGEAQVTTEKIHNPWRLPGQYHDLETGLHYNRFRYYSTVLGRYISRDPLSYLAGTHFYAYVGNNPTNQTDPLGLSWKAALSFAAGVVTTVAIVAAVALTAPVSIPTLIAATAAGAFVGFGLNEYLNQEEFCLNCILFAGAHPALDILGFLPPPIGMAADRFNAFLYTVEGDYLNAAISIAAIYVDGSTIARWIPPRAKKIIAEGATKVIDYVKPYAQQASKQIKDKMLDPIKNYFKRPDIPSRSGPIEIEFREPVQLDEFNRLNQVDVAVGKLKPGEASAAVEIQNVFGGQLRRANVADGDIDFVFMDGPNQGKTVDFMFTVNNQKQKNYMNQFFENNFDRNVQQLNSHVQKADIVPLDFRNLDIQNQARLMEVINNMPVEQASKIVIMK